MLRKLLKSKIHRARLTGVNLHYEGSLAVDAALLRSAGMLPNEAVHVWNVNNGERLETYLVPAPEGSGAVCLYGSAARRGQPGDLLIIATFAWMESAEAERHQPRILHMGPDNQMVGAEAAPAPTALPPA
jgi:aspartate 1-decarboxylase